MQHLCHNPKLGYCPSAKEYRDNNGRLDLAKYAKAHPNVEPQGPGIFAWDGSRPNNG